MRVRGPARRVRWKHLQRVPIPEKWQPLLWDHPEGTAPLEKLILRVLQYGTFADLQDLYHRYPEAVADVARRHAQEVPRGVHFWIRAWEHERCS